MNLNSKQKDVKSDPAFKKEATSDVYPVEMKEQKFDELFFSPNGLQKIAQALKKPLKKKLDYVGIIRKVFYVDPLPIGEIPAYDRDIPEFPAVKVAYKGAPPIVEYDIERIQIPTFKISVDEPVDYEDILIRRYPVFNRAKERVAISQAIAEDLEGLKLLEKAVQVGPNPVLTATGLTKTVLADAYAEITKNQLQAGAIVMNPYNYADILKWKSDDLDQVTLNEVIDTGAVGSLWNTLLIVSTKVPVNSVYAVTTPFKLGVMPERKPVEIKIWDYAIKTKYYVIGFEVVGFGIHNTAGVVKINIA